MSQILISTVRYFLFKVGWLNLKLLFNVFFFEKFKDFVVGR